MVLWVQMVVKEGWKMIKKYLWNIFLVIFLTFSFGAVTNAEDDYEANVDLFLANPDQKFRSHSLVESGSLLYELEDIVGDHEFSWNELKKAIEANDDVTISVYLDEKSRPSDFKIFKGIKLKNLIVHTELKDVSLLNPEYLEHLEYLTIKKIGDQLNTVDLSGFDKLKFLSLQIDYEEEYTKNIKKLILPRSGNLERVFLSDLDIDELTLTGFDQLDTLSIKNSSIKNLTLKDIPGLEYFELTYVDVDHLHMENVHYVGGGFDFRFFGAKIKNFKVNNLTGLEAFEFDYSQLESLSITNSKDLNFVYVGQDENDEMRLKNIKLSNLPELESVFLSFTLLEQFDFSNLPKLKELDILGSRISQIDLNNPIFRNLTSLRLDASNISSIDLSPVKGLTYLSLRENNLKHIDLSGLVHLVELDLSKNQLSNINLKGLTKLKKLYLEDNNLSTLDLKDQKELFILYVGNNNLTSLDFAKDIMGTINFLSIYGNKINLLSKENKPIHEKLLKILPDAIHPAFGEYYQYSNQRVPQVDETKSAGSKDKNSKNSNPTIKNSGKDSSSKNKQNNVVTTTLTKTKDSPAITILDSKSKVVFPSDLPDETTLEVSTIDPEKVKRLLDGTPYVLAGDIFEFKLQDGVTINEPFKLELNYNSEQYPLDKWDVAIYYYNEETGEWERIESEVDSANSKVTAYVDHFSIYGVLAKPKETVSGYVLPNTATPYYTVLAIGFAILLVGLFGYVLHRRKRLN